MKSPHVSIPRIAALVGISLVTPAFAVVNIDHVLIRNPCKVASSTGFGAVAHPRPLLFSSPPVRLNS